MVYRKSGTRILKLFKELEIWGEQNFYKLFKLLNVNLGRVQIFNVKVKTKILELTNIIIV